MLMKNSYKLFISLLICFAVGITAGYFTREATMTWYPTLSKPSWTPPNAVFGPVWMVLYFCMGIALWRVWINQKRSSWALPLFGVQLVLNFAWSFLFFTFQSPFIAFLDLSLLWVFLLLTIIFFWDTDFKAGILLLPYILWITFAGFLNFSIWILNR